MNRFRTLFLDAAGTIIRPAEPPGEAYARIGREHGLQVTAAAMKQAFVQAWKGTAHPLHPEGCPPADDDRAWWLKVAARSYDLALGGPVPEKTMLPLFDQLYDHYGQADAWTVYDDVPPVLEDLAGDHELIVLSNFDRRLHRVLEGHDLRRFFRAVIVSSEVGASKPHARMFAAALNAAGAPAAACLHVGDDEVCDAQGAAAAGVGFFHVERPERGFEALRGFLRAR